MPQLTRSCWIKNLRRSARLAACLLLGGIALSRPIVAQSPIRLLGQAKPLLATPAPPALTPMPATEPVEMFNPREVQLSWQNRHWLLVHQGHVLKDFAMRYEEARQALRLIQDLGLNQHGVIGSPVPHLEYWLVDGQAPHAMPYTALRTVPLEVAHLRVEKVQNQWCIRDANRVLFNFAEFAEEAQQALAVMKKYQFAQVGFVGQVMPSMIVFLGRPQADTPALPVAHGAGAMGRQLDPPHFSRLANNADDSPRMDKPSSAPHASTGVTGIIQPLIPPLFVPMAAFGTGLGTPTSQLNQQAVAWHTKPQFSQQFAPGIGQQAPVLFDWRQVQIHQDNGTWQLTAGSLVLARFGSNKQEAQKALTALRHYRFTEQYAARGDKGSLPYYLAPGAAPRGVLLGMQCEEIQPDKLQVRQQPTGYAICQGDRVVLPFRDRPELARQTLEAIQRQHLDRVCHLGEPGKEGMMFLVRSR